MATVANELLDLLEKRAIMAPHDVESLREQVNDPQKPPHASFVARRLVQLGYLNPYFAKTLLSEAAQRNRSSAGSNPAGESHEPRHSADYNSSISDEDLIKIDAVPLPRLEEFDLLSDDSAKHASLIPVLKPRQGLSAIFHRSSQLHLEQSVLWWRVVLALGIVAAVILLVLAIYFVARSA
ncbi:MAG: hypothetical protein VB853_01890 [Pirellulales bacterium]